jgi:glycosyltransferase involved in cell wall biosynthesis/CDP-glycerol glycerophosphotransferase (TagB/SpsB family)
LNNKTKLKDIVQKRAMSELLKPSNFRAISRHYFSKSKKFTIASAVFNVEEYVDEFLQSIVKQDFDLSQVEVILVNDGSTDGTAEKIEAWAHAHPSLIRVIHQENQGVCSARNVGLNAATGDWITFVDPDDFLKEDYLLVVWKEICRRFGTHLAIMCNVIFYMEQEDEFRDTHPIKYRFSRKTTMRAKNMGRKFHVQVATAFFNRHLIEKHTLRFDNKVVPVFEDGHFSNRLFIQESERKISYLPEAEYFYRKRKAQNSLVNLWINKKSGFYDSLKFGNLDLIQMAQEKFGRIPEFLEFVNLYETLWKFSVLRSDSAIDYKLTKEEIRKFWSLIDRIYKSISVETIEKYRVRNGQEASKIGVLSLLKKTSRTKPRVYLIKTYPGKDVMKLRYYSGSDINCDFKAYRNGQEIAIKEYQKNDTFMLDKHYFTTNFFKIQGEAKDQLSFSVDGRPAIITINGQVKFGKKVVWQDAIDALARFELEENFTEDEVALRQSILRSSHQEAYENCWVFLDRKDKADDNGEHLYRHIKEHHPRENAFFVLARDSVDWDRLEKEGFSLLEFGSQDHLAAFCGAEKVISSHCDVSILWPGEKRLFGDLFNFDFIFLQHGVTKDDLSLWLNRKHMNLIITATKPEADAFQSLEGPYIYTQNEVGLTGFPRHDRLLKIEERVDTLLIVPTWREGIDNRRDEIPTEEWENLDYCQAWLKLLQRAELSEMLKAKGLKPLVLLHQNSEILSSVLKTINIPQLRMTDVEDMQRLFKRSAALITDYSSIAFEFGYLQKLVMYYQFDKDKVFKGAYHTYSKGYFDYEEDGFGSTFEDPMSLLSELENCLENGLPPVYQKRAAENFPFRDGNCCERTYQRIASLSPIPMPRK